MTRVYQHNPFFDTTELSTKHTGHQERRMEIARAEIFPDGVPTGLHVAQFNFAFDRWFRGNLLDPPSDKTFYRVRQKWQLQGSVMTEPSAPSPTEEK
jgi:hypothetical protein